ncbi:MAG: SAM-dependent methyltransferase [Paramuribaculum sp.]|nr:SAM-dependent methyltransferase [Paramuribaculum sp.]
MNRVPTNNPPAKGVLYLLPVTIGDTAPLSVLPADNIMIARRVKYFIVENVRTARRFLKKCDPSLNIDELTFFVLDKNTDRSEIDEMMRPLDEGNDICLLSEAGCPAIADPGSMAVAEAHRRSIKVRPLVGPSSILLSLMASGFNGQNFAFCGYLPVDSAQRNKALREMTRRIDNERQTQIFIETPYRNNRLIDELTKALPGHYLLCVASDLTGSEERIEVKTLKTWAHESYKYDKIPSIFLLYRD